MFRNLIVFCLISTLFYSFTATADEHRDLKRELRSILSEKGAVLNLSSTSKSTVDIIGISPEDDGFRELINLVSNRAITKWKKLGFPEAKSLLDLNGADVHVTIKSGFNEKWIKEQLLKIISKDKQEKVKSILFDKTFYGHFFYLNIYDIGAEKIEDTFIVIAPNNKGIIIHAPFVQE